MNELAFETWGVDDSSVVIEYSLVVLEEIRQQVSQGLLRFSRGGIEVGGVLYGTREGRKIRIQAIRAIPCDHASGPSFALSAEDRSKFDTQLAEDAEDPSLRSLLRVGWFVSHTRGELTMTSSDLEFFSNYFRNPWQVTLVIRPGRGSAMRAAFFVWEQDGTVRADQSYKEFNFPDRLAGVIDAPSRAERAEARLESRAGFRNLPPLPAPPAPVERSRNSPLSIFETSQYQPMPAPQRKKWPWLVAGLAALVVLAFVGWRYTGQAAPPEALGLLMTEAQGQLQIQWNNSSRTIRRATKGTLNIADGSSISKVPLTRSELADGHYLYTRKGGDVEVRMEVESTEGPLAESSRFLGRPPVTAAAPSANNAELESIETQRNALEAEVNRLKSQNSALNTRIQQLERTQRILESRLGITK
jgi:proteasome lid subunit RPN8/RPN11